MVGVRMKGDGKKYAFIVTINWGYMFALNCTMNAAKYFGTNADFHILYKFPEMSADIENYMKESKEAFPFDVHWHPMEEGTDYFNAKYKHCEKIKEDYDAVCILDGDLFLCCNVNDLFAQAHSQESYKLITASHLHSGIAPKDFHWGMERCVKDRCHCAFADFPTFIQPKKESGFMVDWFAFTQDHKNTEQSHPLIAMNRSIAKHYDIDDVMVLDGRNWVNDLNYWTHAYMLHGSNMLKHDDGMVHAIHNRWWQHGRAGTEIRNNRKSEHLKQAISNFNIIKSYMEFFNALTPALRITNYVTGKFKA